MVGVISASPPTATIDRNLTVVSPASDPRANSRKCRELRAKSPGLACLAKRQRYVDRRPSDQEQTQLNGGVSFGLKTRLGNAVGKFIGYSSHMPSDPTVLATVSDCANGILGHRDMSDQRLARVVHP